MNKTVKKFNSIPTFICRKERKKQNRIKRLISTLDVEKLIAITEEI